MNEKLSDKQREILAILIKGNGFDETGKLIPCDLDQLLLRLTYKPSKESMQFSIRALMRRGLAFRGEHVNRRNRKRVLIVPTDLARKIIAAKTLELIVQPEPAAPVGPQVTPGPVDMVFGETVVDDPEFVLPVVPLI